MNEYYLKDVKTGKIIPCDGVGGKQYHEQKNLKLKKEGKEYLIRHIVMTDEEVEDYKKSLQPKKTRIKKETSN